MTLDEVLRTVAERVPYLAASTAIEGDDWVRCDAVVDEPARLAEVVRGTAAGFGTDDVAVAASLFAEAYAFRVAAVPLAAFALDLPVPDVAPASVAVRIDKPRPPAVAYLSNTVLALDAKGMVEALVDAHLRPFVTSVHEQFAIGERNLWGNVAAACAVAFRAVESSGVDRAPVRDRASVFFEAGAEVFRGLGAFTAVANDGREGWYWDRTSCCLWFRTAGSELCDNCSLLDPSELHARRIVELRG